MKNKTNLNIFFLVLVFSIVLLTQNAFATHPVTVFGPKTFVRTTGAPNVFQERFSLPTILGKFTLTVNSNKVSSATIKLNGAEIFGQSAFNENVTFLTKEVSPKLGQNTFDIQIAGKPNSSLKLTLTFLSPVKVLVSPEKADVTVKETQQFKATVTGTDDQRVTWEILEKESGKAVTGLGTISETGLYAAPDDAPTPPFITIQATSVANPFEVGTAEMIVRDIGNFGQSNADGDFGADNFGDSIQFNWADLPEETAKIVMFRASNKNGPWEELFSSTSHLVLKPVKSIFYYDTADNLLPFDTANDYFYKMEAYSATGQLLKSYSPVFVPKYVDEENTGQQSSVLRKTQLILLASLSTLIPSTVSSACRDPNDPFITESEFLNNSSMSVEQIRDLLKNLKSWLKGDAEGKILDVDGQMIDFAKVVVDAAKAEAINPQLLLAMAQKENGLLFKETRQKDSLLKKIMNCGNPTTIAKQTQCAAESLRKPFDELKSGQDTSNNNPPWNLSKTTPTIDGGVYVNPANAATGALFAYDPEAGMQWGGDDPKIGGNAAFCKLWHGKRLNFAATTPCPSEPAQLTLTGSDATKDVEQYKVEGGTAPYTWGITEGKGAITPDSSDSSKATVSSITNQCGSAAITVKDSCSNQITKDVRMSSGVWIIVKMIKPACPYTVRIYDGKIYDKDDLAVPTCEIISGLTKIVQAFYHYGFFLGNCSTNPFCAYACSNTPDCCTAPGAGALCSVPYGSYMLYEYHYEWRCQ